MLEAIDLSKNYNGTVALDRLNLRIEQGEIFCLLGAYGAGKTTTINLFLNFIAPSTGTAKINDVDVVEHPLETKRFLAYIPGHVMLYRNLTGLENLEYFTSLSGVCDDLGDFLSNVRVRPEERRRLVAAHASRWGESWIVLPNPMYGSWEAALSGNENGLSRADQVRREREHLRPMAYSDRK